MSRIALALALLLLALPAAAPAKGLGRVELCGADGCTNVSHGATHAVLEGGPAVAAPRTAEPYFTVRVDVNAGEEVIDTFRIRWLPRSGLLRGEDGIWMKASPATQQELRMLSSGLEAAGASRRASRQTEEGGPGTALAIGAPALAVLAAGGLLARRRRRRR